MLWYWQAKGCKQRQNSTVTTIHHLQIKLNMTSSVCWMWNKNEDDMFCTFQNLTKVQGGGVPFMRCARASTYLLDSIIGKEKRKIFHDSRWYSDKYVDSCNFTSVFCRVERIIEYRIWNFAWRLASCVPTYSNVFTVGSINDFKKWEEENRGGGEK